jgi:hypothetical protein
VKWLSGARIFRSDIYLPWYWLEGLTDSGADAGSLSRRVTSAGRYWVILAKRRRADAVAWAAIRLSQFGGNIFTKLLPQKRREPASE